MASANQALEAAIAEAAKARLRVNKTRSRQIKKTDDVAAIKATVHTWFNTHRPIVAASVGSSDLADVDGAYTFVLNATDKHALKKTYLEGLQDAKDALVFLRGTVLLAPPPRPEVSTDDLAPDFSPLAGSGEVRDVLTRRWHECGKCVKAEAHLAAIVMMGGFLEALFVARANKLADKSILVGATNAPKDKSTGKVTNYQDWMLDTYIKVGRELGWITESAKDVADKLKEYRNFVHPAKELRYGVTLGWNDSSLFWQVTKALARQLLLSA